jgi:hypothetical protein
MLCGPNLSFRFSNRCEIISSASPVSILLKDPLLFLIRGVVILSADADHSIYERPLIQGPSGTALLPEYGKIRRILLFST